MSQEEVTYMICMPRDTSLLKVAHASLKHLSGIYVPDSKPSPVTLSAELE